MTAKKTATKKTASKKTATKKTTKKRTKKPSLKERVGKRTTVTFMVALIHAGYLGDSIPESSGDKTRSAAELRRMAEKLSAQALRYGDEDVGTGGDAEE